MSSVTRRSRFAAGRGLGLCCVLVVLLLCLALPLADAARKRKSNPNTNPENGAGIEIPIRADATPIGGAAPAAAKPAGKAAKADKKSKSEPDAKALPQLNKVLAQNFVLSVMSQKFGVFNATVRSRISYAFNDFIQGEVIPVNTMAAHPNAKDKKGAYLAGHFSRERDADDDRLVMGMDSSVLAQNINENNYLAVDGKKEPVVLRPTLFYFEIKLRHANAASGRINIFYVPSDKKELEKFKDRLDEGAINDESRLNNADDDNDFLKPLVSASFSLRPESKNFTGLVLTSVEELAQQSSAFLDVNTNYFKDLAGDKDAKAVRLSEGSLVLRLFSEHEFTLFLQVPALAADGTAIKAGQHDHVWVHAYTKPNKLVYGARKSNTPTWTKYMMPLFLIYTFVMQGMMGSKEGKVKREAELKLASKKSTEESQIHGHRAPAAIKPGTEETKEKPTEEKEKKDQ